MHRVFVYGTLKRGFRNHRFLESANYLGEAYTIAEYRMLDGRFPVLRDAGPDLKPVGGEVYDVDNHTLSKLDDLESVESGMYERTETDIVFSDGRASQAFIYIGCADYWDKEERVAYRATDKLGHLNWIAPDKRPK